MTTLRNDKALREQGQVGTAKTSNSNRSTKLDRVIAALHNPRGLNRFEAERIGEHCLNSTIAIIRKLHGSKLIQQWETVPTRFCERGVRVLRYWIVV